MGDPERGLYEKYRVQRTDGSDAPGEKHDGCEYFVLDLTHDDFAIPAIQAYAMACADKYPSLSEDLLRKVREAHAGRTLERESWNEDRNTRGSMPPPLQSIRNLIF
jgi:hypothetical protein